MLTPDLCHVDQLTFTVRYLRTIVLSSIEPFIEFTPIRGHTAKYLTSIVFEFAEEKQRRS